MGASATGRTRIVSALITAGADVNARANVRTLDRAKRVGFLAIVNCKQFASIVFDLQAGDTPLYLATKYGHADAADLLRAVGAVAVGSPTKSHGLPSFHALQSSSASARSLLDIRPSSRAILTGASTGRITSS